MWLADLSRVGRDNRQDDRKALCSAAANGTYQSVTLTIPSGYVGQPYILSCHGSDQVFDRYRMLRCNIVQQFACPYRCCTFTDVWFSAPGLACPFLLTLPDQLIRTTTTCPSRRPCTLDQPLIFHQGWFVEVLRQPLSIANLSDCNIMAKQGQIC